MRIVIQRVKESSVYFNTEEIASINQGLIILVCFTNPIDLKIPVKKILSLKLFNNWKESVIDSNKEILLLSQFTLVGKIKNSKVSFHKAMDKEIARQMFDDLYDEFLSQYENVRRGVFGEYLNIRTVLDGPCTILIDF